MNRPNRPGPRSAATITVFATVATMLVMLAAPAARAQTLGGDRPTQGVAIPGGAVAGDADATAVELNPAQLGLLGGSSLVLVGNASTVEAPLPGRGLGVMLAAPLVLQSALGVGVQAVQASRTGTGTLDIEAHTKVQLSYAVRLGRRAALGADWTHVSRGSYGGLNTFDLGASWRPGRALSVGVVVRDVTEPSQDKQPSLPRLWAAEVALRPTGTDRFELGLASAHAEGDDWGRVPVRVRALARLTDGLRLFADFESLPGAGANQHAFADGSDVRASAGLWVDLEHLGSGLAARVARPGVGDSGVGASVMVRASSDRYPALTAPQRIERINLAGVDTDREYLDLVRRLRAMATADGVAGVLLRIENLQLGWGRIEELRELVATMRARGRSVFAYVTFPSMREYYLASACNAILAHPAGELSVRGLGQTVTFYKGLMDRVGVNLDLVRIAEYKGAMEPFVMTEHTGPVRDNKNQVLDDVYARVSAAIIADRAGGGRGLTDEKLKTIVERGSVTPTEAQQLGLVDAIKDDSEIEDGLRALTGRRALSVVDPDPSPLRPQTWGGRRVAVVLVDGAITDGPSQDYPIGFGSVAGSDTLVAALDECRTDPGIGAVVLRVNSPGGSAFASDVIARSIQRLRKTGKPVIVSMGDVAASGGYYIAAPGDAVFAEPSTITGSIGIFAYKVDVKKLIGTLGVSVETFRRGQHADFYSPYRPWTEDEVKMASEKIRHFYQLFLETVAAGRKAKGLTVTSTDALGRGHVWTGSQALGLGLVDTMGGISAAIDQATRLGRVPVARGGFAELTVLPRPRPNPLEKLAALGVTTDDPTAVGEGGLSALTAKALASVGRGTLRLLLPLLSGNGSGIEARMPYDLEIE